MSFIPVWAGGSYRHVGTNLRFDTYDQAHRFSQLFAEIVIKDPLITPKALPSIMVPNAVLGKDDRLYRMSDPMSIHDGDISIGAAS